MSDQQTVFQLRGEVSASIFPLARSVVMPLFEKRFTEQRFYGPTFIATQVAPKPISVELLSKRTPYNNPIGIAKTLNNAVEAGYLRADSEGEYVVSEKGAKAIEEAHSAFYAHVNKVNKFPAEKMVRLASLLRRLVAACDEIEFKTGKTTFGISHGGHPKVDADSLAEVDQLLDDLAAFRDDAHIAARMPTGVSGQVWETLTFVWNGEENTAEKLAERLPFRNYEVDDYASALDKLQELGWIETGDDGFKVTAEGQSVRDEAEALTNSNYFLPWGGAFEC